MKLELVYIVEPTIPHFTFHLCVYMECRVNVFPLWYDVGVLTSIEAEAVGIVSVLMNSLLHSRA